MLYRKLTRRLLLLLLVAVHSGAQNKAAAPVPSPGTAQVTFYSTGSYWKSSIPGFKHGAFSGLIFDNERQLAHIRPGHFVSFNLAPGKHTFSSDYWMAPTSKGAAHIDVDVVANEHYFIGTYFETTPLLIMSTPAVEEAPCEDAQKDAATSKPLAQKHIKKDALQLAINEATFPSCP